jgi:hypothetical protein
MVKIQKLYLGSYLMHSCIDIDFLGVPYGQRQEVLACRRVLCIADRNKLLNEPTEDETKSNSVDVYIQIKAILRFERAQGQRNQDLCWGPPEPAEVKIRLRHHNPWW